MHVLLTKYPSARIIIGADRNDLNISSLKVGLPRVRHIVTEYTYQRKIHDIIITNLHQFYLTPIVVPPVAPDDPQRGVPSDHSVPIATPMSSNSQCQSKQYRTIQFRPLPQEGIEHFGDWLKTESWNCLNGEMPPTEQVKVMETKFVEKLEKCLPQKQLKISSHEKPWINFEIKYLDRRKKREYAKHGRSEKYLKLKKKYDLKFEEAAKRYLEKNVSELKVSNPGKAYKILKRMGAHPSDCDNEGSFTLQNHIDENLSTEQSIERIANFFAEISQEYPPLDCDQLPQRVKVKLRSENSDQNCVPTLSENDVVKQIISSKKTNSMVPGDLPKPVLQEFPNELAKPVTKIFRSMLETKQWPATWRTEYGVP